MSLSVGGMTAALSVGSVPARSASIGQSQVFVDGRFPAAPSVTSLSGTGVEPGAWVLAFTPPESGTYDSIEVQQRVGVAFEWSPAGSANGATEWTASGLGAGDYYIRIRALNGSFASAWVEAGVFSVTAAE